MTIDTKKLRLALEIANPDTIVTDKMVNDMHEWCMYQIEIVDGILEGRLAPQFDGEQLKIYKYPTDLAVQIYERLNNHDTLPDPTPRLFLRH